MKKTNIKQIGLLSALALGLAVSASAQSMQATLSTPAAAPLDTGPGLIGTNYTEISIGYQRESGAPKDLRDYELLSNGSGWRQGNLGVDGNFKYDYETGDASGYSDRRQEAELGATGYLLETWGKAYITGDGGMAWQHAGGVSRKSYAYSFNGGVEFQILPDLVLTPFIEYQAEPKLYDHAIPSYADFPDHLWDVGVKATYRFAPHWNASVSLDADQRSARDLGFRAGLSYRY